MKIGTSSSNTLITSTGSSNKFKIEATGKAFTILSSALYQYKVKAVVREIGCNAYDAHIDAKNTQTPFHVSLPTKEDPHFKVRDFGVGLAKDKFVDVYTTYFGSSKSDSNDHTGGLGLGSKTPFIMSKTFTVHSYYDGIEYMWHSYVNDNGEPDITLLLEKETTEPNGLHVIVPIGQGLSDTEKNALYREFRQEAETIYQWFDVQPQVTANGTPISIKPRLHGANTKYDVIKLKGVENTRVYFEKEHSKASQSNEILIKMGNVVYPYKLSEVRNLDRFGGNIQTTQSLITYLTVSGRLNNCNVPLVLEVGMGDVDIAPSRESLSLTNTTEVTIINAMVRFVDMFFEQLQSNIDNAKSTYEKYMNLYAVPPIKGRTFKVDGKEVDPHKQNPVWAFGPAQSFAGKENFLRKFLTDDYVVKYRRAGLRGINPVKTAIDMAMYGPGQKDRTVVLIDKAYKGELRLWINSNLAADTAVVVVFGADSNGIQRPMTDAEMAPFLEDKHPQVVKFSSFKNQPVTATRTGIKALKLADDSMFVMRGTHSYHFFTQGNTDLEHISNVKAIDAKKEELPVLYVAYRRAADGVSALMQDKTDGKKTEMQVLGAWSRSQSSNTSWSEYAHMIHYGFRKLPTDLGIKEFDIEINGTKHKVHVNNVKHVVLNKEAYAEVVGNADYPQFLTFDDAFKKLVLPIIPDSVDTYKVDNYKDDMYIGNYGVSNQNHWASKFYASLGISGLQSWMTDLEKKINSSVAYTIRKFTDVDRVKAHHYAPASSKQNGNKLTHHVYDFSTENFKKALWSMKDSVAGAKKLHELLCLPHGDFRSYLGQSGYGSAEPSQYARLLIQDQVCKEANYSGLVLGNALVDYYENTHKKS